jgi:hypothetical protein
VNPADDPAGGRVGAGAAAVRLGSPAELVAAVPTLLRYHPRDSVVIIGLLDGDYGHRVGPVLRGDLPTTPTQPHAGRATPQAVAEAVGWTTSVIAAVPTHLRLSAAVVITLAERLPPLVWPLLRVGFEHLNLPIHAAVHAESTHPGAAWTCLCAAPDCCEGGVLAGGTSVLETHAVLAGHVRYATREQWVDAGMPGTWDGVHPPGDLAP